MAGRISSNCGDEILAMLKGLGYFAYTIQDDSVSIIDTFECYENRNFLFLPHKLASSIVPFHAIINQSFKE